MGQCVKARNANHSILGALIYRTKVVECERQIAGGAISSVSHVGGRPEAEQLRRRASHLLEETPFASHADAPTWPALVAQVQACYSKAIAEWRATYESLLDAWRQADDSTGNSRRQANALRFQAMAFHEMTVIEALADEQFLPRYGFPIGLLRLRVLTVTESDKPDAKAYVREEDQYRLERPGILAMREYVPGASFFVGNKVVTSHGLLKHWTGENLNTAIGFRGQMAECVNGHRFYSFNADLGPCSVCGAAERRTDRNHCSFPASVSARQLGTVRNFVARPRHRSVSLNC